MAGQKPRQGWIYWINPYRVSLRCKLGHVHIYNLDEPGEVECQTCKENINSSRVFRGTHPYIIWTSDQFQDESGYIATFSVIPLTSQTTFNGLPTTYPINRTARNGLDKNSYVLVHQICTVDANSFKDSSENWLNRIGQLDKPDKEAIEERLKYFLNIQDNPSEDWFAQNASPEIVKKVFDYLSEEDKSSVIEELINNLNS
ncbi:MULTISPECIES: type II toxin-antitoxin system PemK/MazF family toxin [unclassified Sphaerospermopsis]|uniref:type II toxin-antitoxin system PemK/MazF family toxin n=1 Tax=unclassified Sphaerospermopsis TaxID=2646443 RepID=UPI001681159A|nr:type II toxin-antitoxin system PemK/MazF family toxin [Sphaerospermopsis sp. FACHB-1094]MBD2143752.1 type II toxin-antitoxin system PemK/MazF family toxin [Sphaerospermopsis sp. FACHB-1194]